MSDTNARPYEPQNGPFEDPVLWLATMIARSCQAIRTTFSILPDSKVLGEMRDEEAEECEGVLEVGVLVGELKEDAGRD